MKIQGFFENEIFFGFFIHRAGDMRYAVCSCQNLMLNFLLCAKSKRYLRNLANEKRRRAGTDEGNYLLFIGC